MYQCLPSHLCSESGPDIVGLKSFASHLTTVCTCVCVCACMHVLVMPQIRHKCSPYMYQLYHIHDLNAMESEVISMIDCSTFPAVCMPICPGFPYA